MKKKSGKYEQSKNEGYLGVMCCTSGNVQEPSCLRTVEHSDIKEVGQNNNNNSADHKDKERGKSMSSSKDECRHSNVSLINRVQPTKDIFQTSETIEEHPENLENVLNDTDYVSRNIKKKKKKKTKIRSKEENNFEHAKFAEILIKRLEDVLAKQNTNQDPGSKEKQTADINRTVTKDSKEGLILKRNNSVKEVRNASNTNKRNTHVQFNNGKTTYSTGKDTYKESNARKADEKRRMQKSPNVLHVKDRSFQNQIQIHRQIKPKITYEDCIVFGGREELQKPSHIQSNKYFIIKYDSDHEENEERPKNFSRYNPFLDNVNEMKNGKFYRANSTKQCHAIPKRTGRIFRIAN
ncbi:probable WRKY transcription factor protein 1 [Mytilus edulis]|uniref:probable WRKY transcription factor protein 1 n=1 Tax=Mytilus edulis TaxID=6550 RepID=UPI0039F0E0CF